MFVEELNVICRMCELIGSREVEYEFGGVRVVVGWRV